MNSIKCNTLRLGNIVKLRDTGDIVKVVSLTSQEVGYHYKATNPVCFCRKYSEIEGVLIRDHWRKIDCPELSYDDRREGSNWYSYRPFVLDCPLRYLHELQNLHFALTGEEQKIEL